MTPIQQLDTVLFLLQKDRGHISFDHIMTRILMEHESYPPIFYGDILRRILYKLCNDGLVYTEQQYAGKINYAITYEGFLFHGYVEQKRIDDLNQIINENAELARQRNDMLLVRGTWFAGIAALLLLVWYIFLWINPTYSDFPYILFGITVKNIH